MIGKELLIEKYKLNELNSILCKCEEAIETTIETNQLIEMNDYVTFLLYSLGKSFVSTREVLALCKSGLPDGALAIARNIFEQFILVAYLDSKRDKPNFDKLLERYNDDYYVQRAKALRFNAEYVIKNKVEGEKYNEEIRNIKNKYGILKVMKDYWWTEEPNMDFSKLCDYVVTSNKDMEPFIRLMQLIYKRACIAIHASAMGNRIRLGSNEQVVDMGPWTDGQESSLFLATEALIYIIGSTFSVMEIENDDITGEINNLAIYYYDIIRKMEVM